MPEETEVQSGYLHSRSHNLIVTELEYEHRSSNNNFRASVYHSASLENALAKIGFLRPSKIDLTPENIENHLLMPKLFSLSFYHVIIGRN